MAEPIVFTSHYGPDGSVVRITASHFPDEIEIAMELFVLASKGEAFGVRVEGDRIVFDVANGFAEYQLGEHDIRRQVSAACLVSGGLYESDSRQRATED